MKPRKLWGDPIHQREKWVSWDDSCVAGTESTREERVGRSRRDLIKKKLEPKDTEVFGFIERKFLVIVNKINKDYVGACDTH